MGQCRVGRKSSAKCAEKAWTSAKEIVRTPKKTAFFCKNRIDAKHKKE